MKSSTNISQADQCKVGSFRNPSNGDIGLEITSRQDFTNIPMKQVSYQKNSLNYDVKSAEYM